MRKNLKNFKSGDVIEVWSQNLKNLTPTSKEPDNRSLWAYDSADNKTRYKYIILLIKPTSPPENWYEGIPNNWTCLVENELIFYNFSNYYQYEIIQNV